MNEEYNIYKFISNKDETHAFEELLKNKNLVIRNKLDWNNWELIKKWIYHCIFTLGKVKLFALYNNEGIVHYSFVCSRSIKFLFLRNSDFVIGPCWTKESFRGNKIYPITINYLAWSKKNINLSSEIYILVRENNIESTNAVVHAGTWFPIGRIKKNIFKQYKDYILYEKKD